MNWAGYFASLEDGLPTAELWLAADYSFDTMLRCTLEEKDIVEVLILSKEPKTPLILQESRLWARDHEQWILCLNYNGLNFFRSLEIFHKKIVSWSILHIKANLAA